MKTMAPGGGDKSSIPCTVRNHVSVQVAPSAGIDLPHFRPGRTYPLSVQVGCLVTLKDGHGYFMAEIADGAFQQGRFASTRWTHQVDCKYAPSGKPTPVAFCKQLVLGEQVLLQRHDPAMCDRLVMVLMIVRTMLMDVVALSKQSRGRTMAMSI
jgi:hypothetical protein